MIHHLIILYFFLDEYFKKIVHFVIHLSILYKHWWSSQLKLKSAILTHARLKPLHTTWFWIQYIQLYQNVRKLQSSKVSRFYMLLSMSCAGYLYFMLTSYDSIFYNRWYLGWKSQIIYEFINSRITISTLIVYLHYLK